jgi:hypothetical protein
MYYNPYDLSSLGGYSKLTQALQNNSPGIQGIAPPSTTVGSSTPGDVYGSWLSSMGPATGIPTNSFDKAMSSGLGMAGNQAIGSLTNPSAGGRGPLGTMENIGMNAVGNAVMKPLMEPLTSGISSGMSSIGSSLLEALPFLAK